MTEAFCRRTRRAAAKNQGTSRAQKQAPNDKRRKGPQHFVRLELNDRSSHRSLQLEGEFVHRLRTNFHLQFTCIGGRILFR